MRASSRLPNTPNGDQGVHTFTRRSQSMWIGAWVMWTIALAAIHFELGWALRSAGPPLAILSTLALTVYLSSGARLVIDRRDDIVTLRRRLLGIGWRTSRRAVALERLELRAAWMARAQRGRTVVYDLVAVGHEEGAPEVAEIEIDEDMALFRGAERRARATAAQLDLPLVVRWDEVIDEESAHRREPTDLDRPIEAPAALAHWWTRL